MDCITGKEEHYDVTTPLGALIEFYKAFNTQNTKLMTTNWSSESTIIMANPIGGFKVGYESIFEGYEKIFNSGAHVYVEYYDFTLFEDAHSFCVTGKERGHFYKADKKIPLAIRTTRFYQKQKGRFHQLHHHGSIDIPSELDNYQRTIKSLLL